MTDNVDIVKTMQSYLKDYPYGIPKEALQQVQELVVDSEQIPFIFIVDYSSDNLELAQFLQQIIDKGLKLPANSYKIISADKFNLNLLSKCGNLLVSFGEANLKQIAPHKDYPRECNQVFSVSGCHIFPAESLLKIKTDDQSKKLFWGALKSYA